MAQQLGGSLFLVGDVGDSLSPQDPATWCLYSFTADSRGLGHLLHRSPSLSQSIAHKRHLILLSKGYHLRMGHMNPLTGPFLPSLYLKSLSLPFLAHLRIWCLKVLPNLKCHLPTLLVFWIQLVGSHKWRLFSAASLTLKIFKVVDIFN